MDKFTPIANDELCLDLNEWVAASGQDMSVVKLGDKCLLTGAYEIRYDGTTVDRYEIRVYFFDGFPIIEPNVFEDGGRIPKIASRHIFPSNGKCCLCVWEDWLISENDLSVGCFLDNVLRTYFLSQTIFEKEGVFPFGELDHDLEGLLQAYSKAVGAPQNLKALRRWLALLIDPSQKASWLCSCPDRKSVMKCNCGKLDKLKVDIPPFLAKQMLKRIDWFAKNDDKKQ